MTAPRPRNSRFTPGPFTTQEVTVKISARTPSAILMYDGALTPFPLTIRRSLHLLSGSGQRLAEAFREGA